ncbi:MAG: acetyltransferase, partial [Bacteroidota bacterium]
MSPPTRIPIAVFGAGGFGREVAWLLSDLPDQFEVLGFVADQAAEVSLNGRPVYQWEAFRERFPRAALAVAVGRPALRAELVGRGVEAGYSFPTIIHPSVQHSTFIECGEGTVLCAGNILTVDIVIGRHVHVNLACTIGHDVRIGDFATLSPGVNVSGNVHIGRGAYIGTGASIINGTPDRALLIGEHAVVAAGACVTADVPAQTMVAG